MTWVLRAMSSRSIALVVVLSMVVSCRLDQLVKPGDPQALLVDPPALADSAPLGSTAMRNRSVTVSGDPMFGAEWKAAVMAGSGWLQLTRAQDTIPSQLVVVLRPAGLAAGTYEDTIVVTTVAGKQGARVPVRFQVLPPGPAGRLMVTAQPSSIAAGTRIGPVVVTAQDAAGRTATSFDGMVSISIGANPANGQLAGTRGVMASNGVATFSDLTLDRAGSGYTLLISAPDLGSVETRTFNVTTGAASALAFTTQPQNVSVNSSMSPVRVTVYDASGNVATGYSGSVTVALGANPGGGSLAGTTTEEVSGGSAVFTDLNIDRTANGYTLQAFASGLASATSSAFNVTRAPVSGSRSSVGTSPQGITASSGSSASTITVTARDAAGNPVAGAPVTLSVSGSGNSLSRSSGTTGESGVFTATLSSTRVGTKAVTATAGGVTLGSTATVSVSPGAAAQLTFTGQPTDTEEDENISPAIQVTAYDQFGNVATGYSGNVTISIASGPGTARLSGSTTRGASSGVATFNNLRIDRRGNFTLRASASGLTAGVSDRFEIDD